MAISISSVDAIPLRIPLKTPVRAAFGMMTHRNTLLVRIESEKGDVGWGESWVNFPGWALAERTATVLQGVKPLLIGEEPLQIRWLIRKMWEALRPVALQWGAIGPVSQAISAAEIALWDLAGRILGLPVHRLLGGAKETSVDLYASGIGPERAGETAAAAARAGYKQIKLKVGFDRRLDLQNIRAVRQAIGDDVAFAVDANQGWSVDDALKMDVVLQDHDICWVEEPLPADDYEGMARLRREIKTPLAAGENVYGLDGFRRLLDMECVDIVQPDVTKTGGILETATIAEMAVSRGLEYAPHFLGSAVGLVASAHLLAALPGGRILECDTNPNPLRETLFNEPLEIERGSLRLPDRPGLGYTLNQEVIDRYASDYRST